MVEFNLKEYFSKQAETVNSALGRVLPPETGVQKNLHASMRYSVMAGGKRLRPILVLAATEALGGSSEEAMNTACAFECIHTYSLIHDDLPAMDDDDFRRGKPTCHKAFDEATAILAGDALLTFAFELIARTQIRGGQSRLLNVVKELSRGAGYAGMVGGQVMDIENEKRDIPFPLLESIHIHKTGALIVAAVRSGAVLAGANEGELSALTTYGESVGLAFQIADDILDIEGTDEELGKPAGSDLKLEKATYPALMGLSESKTMARELVDKGIDAISGFDQRAEPLRAIAGFIIDRRN